MRLSPRSIRIACAMLLLTLAALAPRIAHGASAPPPAAPVLAAADEPPAGDLCLAEWWAFIRASFAVELAVLDPLVFPILLTPAALDDIIRRIEDWEKAFDRLEDCLRR